MGALPASFTASVQQTIGAMDAALKAAQTELAARTVRNEARSNARKLQQERQAAENVRRNNFHIAVHGTEVGAIKTGLEEIVQAANSLSKTAARFEFKLEQEDRERTDKPLSVGYDHLRVTTISISDQPDKDDIRKVLRFHFVSDCANHPNHFEEIGTSCILGTSLTSRGGMEWVKSQYILRGNVPNYTKKEKTNEPLPLGQLLYFPGSYSRSVDKDMKLEGLQAKEGTQEVIAAVFAITGGWLAKVDRQLVEAMSTQTSEAARPHKRKQKAQRSKLTLED